MFLALPLTLLSFIPVIIVIASLRIRPLWLAPVALAIVHIVVLQALVLAAGLLAVLTPIGLGAWAGALFFFAGVSVLKNRATLQHEFACLLTACRECGRQLGARGATGLAFTMALFVVLVVIAGFLTGPFITDALTGYLLPPADWVAYGRIFDVKWIDPVCYRPQGHGLLVAWWMSLLGSLRASVIAELHWTFLLWASVWALTRQLGGSVRVAACAVGATLAIPVLWAMNVSGLSDLAVAATTVAGVAFLVSPRLTRTHFALLLTVVLVGCGAKYSMLPVGTALILIGLVRCWHPPSGRSLPVVAGFLPLLALLVSGYWYLSNFLTHDNPFYPWGSSGILYGSRSLESVEPAPFEFIDLRLGFLRHFFFNAIWDRDGFNNANTLEGTGFGPLAAAIGFPALLVTAFFNQRGRRFCGIVLALFIVTLIFTPPQIWAGRFYCFLAVCAVVAAIVLASRIRFGVRGTLFQILVVVSCVWGAMAGFSYLAPLRSKLYWSQEGVRMLPLEWSHFNYANAARASLDLWKLPPEGKTAILCDGILLHMVLFHGEQPRREFIYQFPLRDGVPTDERNINPDTLVTVNADLLDGWKKRKIHYVLFLCGNNPDPLSDKLLELGLKRITDEIYEITSP